MKLLQAIFVLGLTLCTVPSVADEATPDPDKDDEARQQALDLLGFNQRDVGPMPSADVAILVTGSQWAWSYQYEGDDSFALPKGVALAVRVGKTVRLDITSSDVIHKFSVPAFGIRVEGLPGRIESVWFIARGVGTYFGNCAPTCTGGAGDMPVTIEVLSDEDYEAWRAEMKS